MSEIRQLLASAQRAEVEGDVREAIRLLRSAAEWYASRELTPRAEQMLRQVARLEQRVSATVENDDGFGFGDTFAGEVTGMEVASRGPRLDDTPSAWCSFCCRPRAEVGALVAGPAGSFICRGCVDACASLFGEQLAPSAPVAVPLLRSQQRALERLARGARCALVFGPAGSGKSSLVQQLTGPGLLKVDVVGVDDAVRVREWLAQRDTNRVVLVARGEAPAPALVLRGEHGEERVYDSASLRPFVGEAAPLVDAVVELDPPQAEDLTVFARALLEAKRVVIADEAVSALVSLALKSGGVAELAALVARIRSGTYR